MRNTKDIADAVFRIRDEYLEQKRIKNIKIKKACAAVSVFSMAGIITAGTVYLTANNAKPDRKPEKKSVAEEITEIPSDITTTVSGTSVSVQESTHTSSAVSSFAKAETSTTASISKKTSSTSTSSAIDKGNSVNTISAAANQGSALHTAETTVTVQTSVTVESTQQQTTVIYNDEDDYKEVIKMRVEYVKKYLAALSAAAITTTPLPGTASAQSLYVPKDLIPESESILYIEENLDKMDFDGNGKFDTFDAYALYTYVNEKESLPDGYFERIENAGDIFSDGMIDQKDSDLLKEYCIIAFSDENYCFFIDSIDKYQPEGSDYYVHVKRSVSTDVTAEEREKLLNEYVDESYTYGSDDNKNSFIDYCFKETTEWHGYDYEKKYEDAYYHKFLEGVEKDNIDFDVNEDGKVDMKDLYDIYIYDIISSDTEDNHSFETYFTIYNYTETGSGLSKNRSYNYDTPIRSCLSVSEEYKEKLFEKCDPLYDYTYSFTQSGIPHSPVYYIVPFKFIARYIMGESELDMINTRSAFFENYHSDLNLFGKSISAKFGDNIKSFLRKYFNTADSTDGNKYISSAYDRFYDQVMDYEAMHNNDKYIKLIASVRADYDSGLAADMFDINNDGKVDQFDEYVVEIFVNDLFDGITAKESILPEEMWNHVDKNFDVDKDGLSCTVLDQMVYQTIAGYADDIPQLDRDVYYLKLAEQKGIVDLSDIRPLLEKLCKDKETGDVNLDGAVTAVDASEVLTYYSKISVDADVSNVTEAKMNYMADFNADGVVDNKDASSILTVYAEKSIHN